MLQEIYIIDDDDSSIAVFRELFKNEENYKFTNIKSEQIDIALKNIPSLIIINEDAIERDIIELCQKIRRDEDNTITPVIVVSSNKEKEHRIKILNESIEYYIRKPVDEDYLFYTIKNLGRLLSINRTISPLTGLPGNVQIHAELKKRLLNSEEFSVLYLDLDNFKPYNDVYGFLRGDQVIQYTADVILNCIHSNSCRLESENISRNNCFVGHIGGDDFLAIVPYTEVDKLCQTIIATFDKGIKKFFNQEDLEKGYIESENRKGEIDIFPITGISIGAVIVDKNRFSNILEISEVGTQVKHLAKTIQGSSYAIDRRKNN